ncbi:TPA: hypothetical protein ACH3X3_013799 [Trebouxia sp. C0006]
MAHICRYLTAAVGRTPEKVLTVCDGRQLTANQVLSRVAAFAAAIREFVAVKPGDVVILAINSTDRFLESLLAVTATGAIAAPINLRWSITEAANAVNLCQATTILVDTANQQFLQLVGHPSCSCLQQAVLLTEQPATAATANNQHDSEQLINHHVGASVKLQHSPNGAALICFSSGTTGQPKGVLLSHEALHWQAMAKIRVVGYNASDVYLHAAPLFHIGGLSSAVAVLMAGGTHLFMGRFTPGNTLDVIQSSKVTAFIAVPAMMADLAAAAAATGTGTRPCSSVQRILVGAGAMSPEVEHKVQAVFPNTAVHTAYGMTEACSSMTFRLLFDPKHSMKPLRLLTHQAGLEDPPRSGVNVGSPPPGIEMSVLTSSGGHLLSHEDEAASCIEESGEGELLTKGPHVMMQYWRQPAETASVMLPGGWLRTGDIGAIDPQGQVWLNGRVKDVIRTGGESVHAVEVEKALVQIPAIQAAAVFGLPDERFGEQVSAVIVLNKTYSWTGILLSPPPFSRPTVPLTMSFIKRLCQESKLSSFKVPRVIAAQYKPLPLNASGKVTKLKLKEAMVSVMQHKPAPSSAEALVSSKL